MAKRSLTFKKSPSLPFVELRYAVNSSACFHAHTHDEFSFGVIDQGAAVYQNQRRANDIGTGITVTINPGDVHACNPKDGAWSYRMIFVDTLWISCLQDEMGFLKSSDYQRFSQQLFKHPQIAQGVSLLYQALSEQSNQLQAETLLITQLTQLMSVPESANLTSHKEQEKMVKAREILLDQSSESVGLFDIAKTVGLSRYQLIRAFRDYYGQTPHAYLLDYRIKQAKHYLQQGRGLSQVALDLGFADQAHFQRHFKRRLAVTPKQYQAFFHEDRVSQSSSKSAEAITGQDLTAETVRVSA